MNHFSEIKHIRFNRQSNHPYVFDCDPKRRANYYLEHKFSHTKLSSDLILTKTLGWGDNNHLCKTDYYKMVIAKLVGERKTFPEHPCNLASNSILHPLFGTFIYGEIGNTGVIEHLDGRGTVKEQQPEDETVTMGEHQAKRWREFRRLNQLRLRIGLERIIYRAIAYKLLLKQWRTTNNK